MILSLKKFGKSFNTRPFARKIFSEISPFSEKEIILDFSGVDSATPSFCHEMMSILILEKKKKINIKNVSNSVKTQIQKAYFVLQKEKDQKEMA